MILIKQCLHYALRSSNNTGAALLGQEIFVAGGQAEKEVINSAEVYNPEMNQWEHMVARMITPRVGLSLVSLGNLIYAIGKYMIIDHNIIIGMCYD